MLVGSDSSSQTSVGHEDLFSGHPPTRHLGPRGVREQVTAIRWP